MTDKPEDLELVDYEPELFVGDGELWLRNRDEFCDTYKVLALNHYDGCAVGLVAGRGWVALDELVSPKPGRTALKPV